MTLKLTQEMRDALKQDSPIEVEDDETHQVLVAREEFRQQGQDTLADPDKLKAAIMARRDESREVNADWEHADSEVWEADSPSNK